MSEFPFFSIVIPTYNRASRLTGALQSVVRQQYENWECIIVDDGSTDDTSKVVKTFKDNRLKYFFKKNEERSIARNFGINEAKGRYICFLDSDDQYFPNHLQYLKKNIDELKEPMAFFHTGAIEIRGERIIERPQYSDDYGHPFHFLLNRNIMINAACIHKRIFSELKFPEKYYHWEDTHLWLRIVLKHPFIQLRERTTQRNFHLETSVNELDNFNFRRFKNYIECIEDLYSCGEEILRFWPKKDFLIFKKNLILQSVIRLLDQKEYKKVLLFYYLGTLHCEFSFQINFFFQIKRKIENVKIFNPKELR